MRVGLHAGFSSFDDMGMTAVELACALDDLGAEVVPFPTSIHSGLPQRFTDLLVRSPFSKLIDVHLTIADATDDMVRPFETAPARDMLWLLGPTVAPPAGTDAFDVVATETPGDEHVVIAGILPGPWITEREEGKLKIGHWCAPFGVGRELVQAAFDDADVDADFRTIEPDQQPIDPTARRNLFREFDVLVFPYMAPAELSRTQLEFMATGGVCIVPGEQLPFAVDRGVLPYDARIPASLPEALARAGSHRRLRSQRAVDTVEREFSIESSAAHWMRLLYA